MTTSHFVVRVHAAATFDQNTPCEKVSFAENKTGDLIGFRCKGDTNWQLIRLGHDNRHFFQCTTSLTGDRPDFSKVEPLVDASASIVGCIADAPPSETTTKEGAQTYEDLADELRSVSGEAAVVRMLGDTQESKLPDDWIEPALGLSLAGRGDLEKRICPVLAAPVSTMHAYERAARLCSYDAPGAGDGALARVRKLFTLPPPSPEDATKNREGVEWWLLVAAHTHAREAGEAACTYLSGESDGSNRSEAAIAIAASKVKCPAASDLVGCGRAYDCDDHTCTEAEAAPTLATWLARAAPLPAAARSKPKAPGYAMTALLAAYAQGPFSKTFALMRARRTYSVSEGSGPPCTDRADAGAACTCKVGPNEDDMCGAPRDGGLLVMSECAFRIDDKRHAVGDVHHVCASKSAPCTSDDGCCAGLRCAPDDANIDHCE